MWAVTRREHNRALLPLSANGTGPRHIVDKDKYVTLSATYVIITMKDLNHAGIAGVIS